MRVINYYFFIIIFIIVTLLIFMYSLNTNNIEHLYQYQVFQPFSSFTNTIIPYIHTTFLNTHYNRENLLEGRIPTNPHTILIGLNMHHLDTLTSYVVNQLLMKIILYRSKQFNVLQIDYNNDVDIIDDLENQRITYGVVSAPVLARHIDTYSGLSNMSVVTNFTSQYIYGITLSQSRITSIKYVCGKPKRLGVNVNNYTVLYLIQDIIKHQKLTDIVLIKYDNDNLLQQLLNNKIDMFILIDEFPNDIIRNLLVTQRDIRLVDMDMGTENIPRYLTRTPLNMDMLTFRNRGINTRSLLPYSNSHADYSIGTPFFISYQFKNILISNGQSLYGEYEIMQDLFNKLHRKNSYLYVSREYPRVMLNENIQLGFPLWLNQSPAKGIITMNNVSSQYFETLLYDRKNL